MYIYIFLFYFLKSTWHAISICLAKVELAHLLLFHQNPCHVPQEVLSAAGSTLKMFLVRFLYAAIKYFFLYCLKVSGVPLVFAVW